MFADSQDPKVGAVLLALTLALILIDFLTEDSLSNAVYRLVKFKIKRWVEARFKQKK